MKHGRIDIENFKVDPGRTYFSTVSVWSEGLIIIKSQNPNKMNNIFADLPLHLVKMDELQPPNTTPDTSAHIRFG